MTRQRTSVQRGAWVEEPAAGLHSLSERSARSLSGTPNSGTAAGMYCIDATPDTAATDTSSAIATATAAATVPSPVSPPPPRHPNVDQQQ